MGLRTKFNLILLFVFIVGFSATGFVAYSVLQKNAREEILHTAGLMMESALSIRKYTVSQVRPLLAVQIKREFLPQTVPAYAATQNISGLRELYPEYTYKEATLNPTNPVNRATDWETTVIEHFRNNESEKELFGERQGATGPSLYMARPIKVNQASCLTCHGTIKDAPETMTARYGTANGFGWKLNEVVGSQIVSVPMSVPLSRAQETFWTFMSALAGVFVLTMVILNVLLNRMVISPITSMSKLAHEASMNNLDVEEFKPKGNDEIASLADSFNRMRRSLVNAIRMLDE